MKIIKNFSIEGKHQKPIVTDVFYNETHQPKKVVIFCHGYKGFKDWGAWNLMAEAFANAGFFFIKFNFSHNGGTMENPIDFPDLDAFGNNNYSIELDDLNDVINWATKTFKDNPFVDINNLILIGHSRGGGITILKSSKDERIKKLITLASVCDFSKRTATIGNLEEWKELGVKYVVNGRTKQQMPHYYQFYEDFKANEKQLDIEAAEKQLQVPHLIIHGNNDTSVSIDEAYSLHKWNPNSQLEIIEEADHVFNVKHPWEKNFLSIELQKVVDLVIAFTLR